MSKRADETKTRTGHPSAQKVVRNKLPWQTPVVDPIRTAAESIPRKAI
jgi:hypothetical protein